jgi:hypothetical protein
MESRRRVLALFLPLAAALLLVGEALTPKGLDHPITKLSTALKEIPIADAHSGRLYLSNLLVIFGLGTLGVSFAAIATLVRARGATLATVAAVVGGLAGFCGGLVNVLVGHDLAAVAATHATPLAAAHVLVTANRGWVTDVFFVCYLGGVVVATLLTVGALWRSRAVPRWLAFLFLIGIVLAAPAPAGLWSVPLQLPFAVAMVALAIRIWDRPTATSPPAVRVG